MESNEMNDTTAAQEHVQNIAQRYAAQIRKINRKRFLKGAGLVVATVAAIAAVVAVKNNHTEITEEV